jgi:sterol desaturase/sphingolipid hydroxylase (fatty acid hydroxylase superfamily)
VIHHEYPQDSLRLVMPPVLSIPLAVLFYFGFAWLLPGRMFAPFFLGFGLGYLCYDMIHYSVHHLPLTGKVGQILKRHHLTHHFKEENRGFGVSSPLWDYIFGTTFSKP